MIAKKILAEAEQYTDEDSDLVVSLIARKLSVDEFQVRSVLGL